MFGPAFKLLKFKLSLVLSANTPAVVASSGNLFEAVVLSGVLRYNSLKLLLTLIKASLKSSPVPSFASVPILIVLCTITVFILY